MSYGATYSKSFYWARKLQSHTMFNIYGTLRQDDCDGGFVKANFVSVTVDVVESLQEPEDVPDKRTRREARHFI